MLYKSLKYTKQPLKEKIYFQICPWKLLRANFSHLSCSSAEIFPSTTHISFSFNPMNGTFLTPSSSGCVCVLKWDFPLSTLKGGGVCVWRGQEWGTCLLQEYQTRFSLAMRTWNHPPLLQQNGFDALTHTRTYTYTSTHTPAQAPRWPADDRCSLVS